MSDVAFAKATEGLFSTFAFMVRVGLGTIVGVAVARAMGVEI